MLTENEASQDIHVPSTILQDLLRYSAASLSSLYDDDDDDPIPILRRKDSRWLVLDEIWIKTTTQKKTAPKPVYYIMLRLRMWLWMESEIPP